jgi:hypothetical protein
MTIWDYHIIVQHHGLFGSKQGIDRKAFEKQLDALGKDGYELAWVLPDQQLHAEKDGNLFIFKRPA